MRRWLEASWYSGSQILLLRPFAMLFGWVVSLRRWAYRRGLFSSGLAGVPVIVVGNITVGGTGKTPLVLWLVQQLQRKGLKVGVVLRGYRAQAMHRMPHLLVETDTSDEVGDEALLLARHAKCTVCVGVDRLAAARLLVDKGCQIIVADDGLQHYALRRDLEIAVVDGARGVGNGALLPAGPLREPVQRLAEVDAVIVNGDLLASAKLTDVSLDRCHTMTLHPQQFVRLGTQKTSSLEDWRGRSVHAVAGIGNPSRFFALLRSLGLQVTEHAFPDHHGFGPTDLVFGDDLDIVMTEKDAVKCASFASDQMWYLSVAVQFKAEDAERLLHVVRARLAGN